MIEYFKYLLIRFKIHRAMVKRNDIIYDIFRKSTKMLDFLVVFSAHPDTNEIIVYDVIKRFKFNNDVTSVSLKKDNTGEFCVSIGLTSGSTIIIWQTSEYGKIINLFKPFETTLLESCYQVLKTNCTTTKFLNEYYNDSSK